MTRDRTKGRRLWDRLMMEHVNSKAVGMGRLKLASLCPAVDIDAPGDSCELHYQAVTANVSQEIRKDTVETVNRVMNFKMISGPVTEVQRIAHQSAPRRQAQESRLSLDTAHPDDAASGTEGPPTRLMLYNLPSSVRMDRLSQLTPEIIDRTDGYANAADCGVNKLFICCPLPARSWDSCSAKPAGRIAEKVRQCSA